MPLPILVRFKDTWFCTFREGESHVSYDGSIRVISSSDGENWSSTAHIRGRPEQDLRDPKLVVAPDGRLMLLGLDRRLQEGIVANSFPGLRSQKTAAAGVIQ